MRLIVVRQSRTSSALTKKQQQSLIELLIVVLTAISPPLSGPDCAARGSGSENLRMRRQDTNILQEFLLDIKFVVKDSLDHFHFLDLILDSLPFYHILFTLSRLQNG